MFGSAPALKREIEAKLAQRIPAALSPLEQTSIRPHPTGNTSLDALLDGGLPLGTSCELTGPECSGRSAIALSLLAVASRDRACAYVDVSDTCSPHSAASAGVFLKNLLWVRFTSDSAQTPALQSYGTVSVVNSEGVRQQSQQQNCGGPHPRGETKGLAPALKEMLIESAERRKKKMEGTPGYPPSSEV